ncbi:MAG: DUF4331 domain-containing protein [Actinomycetota bacterium]|nr:DUF4331 domain-containing protein [Actinomycetota bacterium]
MLALSLALLLSLVVVGGASSHREAPLISEDPSADNTDVWAFVAPDEPDSVTLIGSWNGFQEPGAGPNYYRFGENVLYTFRVDNNGDAVPDVVYELEFENRLKNPDTFAINTGPIESNDDKDNNRPQTYRVTRVAGSERTVLASGLLTPPNNIGPRSTPDFDALADEGVYKLDGGGKVFAGQTDDAFFVDIAAGFDLLGLRPFNEAHAIPLPTEEGLDTFSGANVMSIALQVPKEDLVADDPVIGIHSATYRRAERVFGGGTIEDSGDWVQVSRLGMPLVNEVVIPLGLKDAFNALEPADDAATLSQDDGSIPLVEEPELAGLITQLYGIETPPSPRSDLVAIFLTGIEDVNQPEDVTPSEQLRLNTSIKPTPYDEQDPLGLLAGQSDGFPNGRRLVDDVVDISLRAVAGGTPFTPDFNTSPNNALSDGVDANDLPFLEHFPYLARAHQGYDHVHRHSNAQAAVAPDGGVDTGAGGTAEATAGAGGGVDSTLFVALAGAVVLGALGAGWSSRRRNTPAAPG